MNLPIPVCLIELSHFIKNDTRCKSALTSSRLILYANLSVLPLSSANNLRTG